MAKVIGWMFSMCFLIAGLFLAQKASDIGSIRPVGPSILCFGFVYWFSKSTYENSRPIMTATALILIGTGFLAWFFVMDFTLYFLDAGFYPAWALTVLVAGPPVMSWAFNKYK